MADAAGIANGLQSPFHGDGQGAARGDDELKAGFLPNHGRDGCQWLRSIVAAANSP